MKHMPVLEEMHGPPTIAATWSCTSDHKQTSATPTRHVHATTSDHATTTRAHYTKVTEFPTVHSITRAPLERKHVDLSQPDDRILLMTK
jgi:hypothetical protein